MVPSTLAQTMPRKRAYRKPRPRRRRRKTHKKKAYPGRGMPGFPSNRVVKMRYAEQIRMDAGVAQKAFFNFRANSIFDPNETGGGHQPLGHDQWAQFYNHYIVIGSKITCTYTATTNAGSPSIYGIYLSDDTTVPLTALQICEQGLAKWKAAPLATDGGQPARKIFNTFSAKKFFNINDVKDNRSTIGASFNSNPSDVAIYHMFTQAMDNLANPPAVDVLIIIDYIVMMQEPKTLDGS